jgi:hypothetical protein
VTADASNPTSTGPDYGPGIVVDGPQASLLPCLRCGAAVVLSALYDMASIHDRWHEEHG